jgi:hypothetical protein
MFYAYIVAVVVRFPSIAFTHVLAHFISLVMYRRYPVVRHHFIFPAPGVCLECNKQLLVLLTTYQATFPFFLFRT